MLTDLDTFTIPNALIVSGIGLWLFAVCFTVIQQNFDLVALPWSSEYGLIPLVLDALLGAGIVGGGALLASVVYEQVTRRPSLGGGDIKLLFMIGLFLGLSASVINLFLACLFALGFVPLWRRFGNKKTGDQAKVQNEMSIKGLGREMLTVQALEESLQQGQTKAVAEQNTTEEMFPFGPAIAAATLTTLVLFPSFGVTFFT